MKWDELMDREGTLRWQTADRLQREIEELRCLAVAYWEAAADHRRKHIEEEENKNAG